MNKSLFIVITSINPPNKAMKLFSAGSKRYGSKFIVVGDTKSPSEFLLESADFYSVERQIEVERDFSEKCPTGHYARKNIGYLLAIKQGAEIIIDTDDDNLPYDTFWKPRQLNHNVRVYQRSGWFNVYSLFSESNIWPRGLPLSEVQSPIVDLESLPIQKLDCPIQQGLANQNPDVDAIYRLILPLPQNFRDTGDDVALMPGSWCPFNSQNTTWFKEAFPLLYLPAYCSFRMTDIWRSFVAQRIAATNEWPILFHKSTVWQERNSHDLMRDFVDEIPGYCHNHHIKNLLEALQLKPGEDFIRTNMITCYQALVNSKLIGENEITLLRGCFKRGMGVVNYAKRLSIIRIMAI